MSNQSFDSNGASSASSSDSGAGPIPIARQLSQQSYLSNIQHKMEELLKASGVETPDETADSSFPSAAASSTGAPSSSSKPLASGRVNKMDSFFAQAAAEEEAAAEALAARLAAEAEAKNADANTDTYADAYAVTNDGTESLPIDDTYTDAEADSYSCLLYTSPSPRDLSTSRMPSSA